MYQSWMPTIRRLLDPALHPTSNTFGNGDTTLPASLPTDEIAEVWFLDDYHHGQSIDLNKGLIGEVHSWVDGGRDILNFIKQVLPPPPSTLGQGERERETLEWGSKGSGRKVVGLGHSVGGNAM